MEAVVDVRGLTKRYGDVTALTDLTVEIGTGEIFGLIGPNGAGKTTFVRALTGTIAPTAGDVSIFRSSPRTIDRARLGLLPQAFQPPGRLTGREILRYYAGLYDDARSIAAVLSDVGMAGDADRWFERLSGGQQRRICVAAALVNNPDLLVLDEPTTGIDPAGRRRVWELLVDLRSAGRTILLTTHDMTEAAALSDRVGLLADGRLIEVGEPSALVRQHAGDGRIVVELASPVDEDALESIPGPVTNRGDEIVIEGVSPADVGQVIGSLEEANLSYVRISWEEPTLEDVFLTLTGDGGSPA